MTDQTTLAALLRDIDVGIHTDDEIAARLIAAGVRVGDVHPGHCIVCDGHLDDPYHGPEPCLLCPHAFPHHEFKPVGDAGLDVERLAHAPGCPWDDSSHQPLCSCGLLRYRTTLAGEPKPVSKTIGGVAGTRPPPPPPPDKG